MKKAFTEPMMNCVQILSESIAETNPDGRPGTESNVEWPDGE